MEAKTAEGERKMKKLLAVCLTALVCWVCAGYAEETRVGDTVIFGQYEQDGNLDNGSEPIAWQVLDVQDGKALHLYPQTASADPLLFKTIPPKYPDRELSSQPIVCRKETP